MSTHQSNLRPRYRRTTPGYAPRRQRTIDKAIAAAASAGMIVCFGVGMLSASGVLR